jgi:putative membrane protein
MSRLSKRLYVVPVEGSDQPDDATRRTHLANERTYLAWWRTGLTSLAVALGVGRIVPELAGGETWPYATLGAGYAVLGIVLIAYGSRRQRDVQQALATASYAHIGDSFVRWVTALAIVLAVATLAVMVFQL